MTQYLDEDDYEREWQARQRKQRKGRRLSRPALAFVLVSLFAGGAAAFAEAYLDDAPPPMPPQQYGVTPHPPKGWGRGDHHGPAYWDKQRRRERDGGSTAPRPGPQQPDAGAHLPGE